LTDILANPKLATMDIDLIRSKAAEAAAFLKSMANDRRLMILCELVKGERTVGDLEAVVGLSQSALSQHLAKLREARLVKTRRESQIIHYSLADAGVKRVISVLYDLYCRPARRR
jgi:DNA-binding transcriptional ArsR family regulator